MKHLMCAAGRAMYLLASLLVLTLTAPNTNAAVQGTATDNGNGTYTYDFTVDNSGGNFDIFAWSLEFNFGLPDWNQNDTPIGGDVTVPNSGWAAQAGTPTTGLSAQDFLSLDPSTDVLAGSMLSGFSFTSAFPPGEVSYNMFSPLGESGSGTTVGPALVTGRVPDSGPGLVGFAVIGLLLIAGAARERGWIAVIR